jgi:hypothetical protein
MFPLVVLHYIQLCYMELRNQNLSGIILRQATEFSYTEKNQPDELTVCLT